MKMFVKFDFNTLCKKVLENQFGKLGIRYKMQNFGEIEFFEPLSKETQKLVAKELGDLVHGCFFQTG